MRERERKRGEDKEEREREREELGPCVRERGGSGLCEKFWRDPYTIVNQLKKIRASPFFSAKTNSPIFFYYSFRSMVTLFQISYKHMLL